MDWIAKKTRPPVSERNPLPRDTSIDSDEPVGEEQKKAVLGWRAFALFSHTGANNPESAAPVTPEPPYYRSEQTRDYEKTPPSIHLPDTQARGSEEPERIDAPLSPPTSENLHSSEKSTFHNLMASATDAWIVSQTNATTSSTLAVTDSAPSSLGAAGESQCTEEVNNQRTDASELAVMHDLMASAVDVWIQSQSNSGCATSNLHYDDTAYNSKSDADDSSVDRNEESDKSSADEMKSEGTFSKDSLTGETDSEDEVGDDDGFESVGSDTIEEIKDEKIPNKQGMLASEGENEASESSSSIHGSSEGEMEDPFTETEDDSTIHSDRMETPTPPRASQTPSVRNLCSIDSGEKINDEPSGPPPKPAADTPCVGSACSIKSEEGNVDEPIPTSIKLRASRISEISFTYSMESLESMDSKLEELLSSDDPVPEQKDIRMENLDSVFIRDQIFSWIPAKVLEYHRDFAVVAIDLPKSWAESTFLRDSATEFDEVHLSMKNVRVEERKRLESKFGIPSSKLRKILYEEYETCDLPLQNDEEGKPDMADLVELHFAAILYNLKARHFQQKPYTRVGDVLIAMNPFSWINELYEPGTRDLYSMNLIWEARLTTGSDVPELSEKKSYYDRLGFEPHVYEVSALAYRGLATTGCNQTILVTGESGSGKTETVKIVMNHLATVQQTRPGGLPREHATAKEIVARVLQSSPIFEAFGNAKTVRNDNSSRFGKFTQLQFQMEPKDVADAAGREIPYLDLVGSNCTTYLLEKNRVVNHDAGERTFHIFYQLLAASREFKHNVWPALAERTVHYYSYTAGEIGSVDRDATGWEETIAALATFRFQEDSLKTLLRALVIVLQIGNLIFAHDASGSDEHNTVVVNHDELVELSKLMEIDAVYLEQSFTSRALKTPGGHDDIKVKLSPQNAKESCDALAKEIYAKVFEVLVQKINKYTAYPESLIDARMKCGHVSLLDIFGFERFETNRFEQLCINYANERLHNTYVLDNFNAVKEEYEAEGIDLYDFKLVDNSSILSLLEGNSGLISALDEECLRPKGNAEAFVYKAKAAHKDSPRLIDNRLHRKWEFGIDHFAGPVEYDAQSFVSRNTDKLPVNLIECAAKSKNTLIGDAFKLLLSDGNSNASQAKRNSKKATTDTVLQKFKGQLKSLVAAMEGTKIRYIRCIKPNSGMVPQQTDHITTMQQLEHSGLMTSLTISRESFPNKLPYDFILKRYACLMRDEELKIYETLKPHQKVEHMLLKWLEPLCKMSRNGTRRMPFVCGKTKVFFKPGAQDALEQLRLQLYKSAAIKIQATTRRVSSKRHVDRMKDCLCKIQSIARMVLVRLRLNRKHEAATKISSCIRARWARKLLNHLKREKAACKMQSRARMGLVRMQLRRQHQATTTISSWVRGTLAIQLLNALRRNKAATTIQGYARGYPIRREYVAKKNALRIIYKSVRRYLDGIIQAKIASQDFQETFEYLRDEIDSLRSENDDLKRKVESLDADREKLKLEIESSTVSFATYKYRTEGLIKANDRLSNELLTARQEASKMTRKAQTKQSEFEKKLAVVVKELENIKSTHKNQILDVIKEKESLTSSIEMYKYRTEGLVKANDALGKELLIARQEASNANKKAQMDQSELEMKLSAVVKELEDVKSAHTGQIHELIKVNQEIQSQTMAMQRRHEQDTRLEKERFEYQKEKLKEELKLAQQAHKKQLSGFVDVIGSGQSKRQEDIAKLMTELITVRREKDEHISRLQQEIKALRVCKGESRSIRAALEPRSIQKQINFESDQRSLRATEFEEAYHYLQSLISESCVLPRFIPKRDMQSVIEQQERGQKMTMMLETLESLFKKENDTQSQTSEAALALVKEYVAVTEPNRTISNLQNQLAKTNHQNSRLREQVQGKEYCQRCASLAPSTF